MRHLFVAHCLGAIATGGLLGLVSSVDAPVQAAPVTYDFTVTVTTGTLAGKSFNGSFSYDDAQLKGEGTETLGVAQGLSVCMNYIGGQYREKDDSSYPTFPKLIFENGKITQLNFWVQPDRRVEWWNLPGWDVALTQRSMAASSLDCKKP